jgi:hypothetical protein
MCLYGLEIKEQYGVSAYNEFWEELLKESLETNDPGMLPGNCCCPKWMESQAVCELSFLLARWALAVGFSFPKISAICWLQWLYPIFEVYLCLVGMSEFPFVCSPLVADLYIHVTISSLKVLIMTVPLIHSFSCSQLQSKLSHGKFQK